MKTGIPCVITMVWTLIIAAPGSCSEDSVIVLPDSANVFNVVKHGGIDNTGKTDVTAKIQKLLDERHRSLSVLYFPKGTYLVSGELCMKINITRKPDSHSHGPYIFGESRTETVFRLKDGTWPKPVQDMLKPAEVKKGKRTRMMYPWRVKQQTVLSTGDCTNTTFNKVLRNFTVNIGKNNAGAVGMQYNTSNSGHLSEVDIVSEDGQGLAGLTLAGVENGPGQLRNIRIKGFDVGLYFRTHYVFGCTNISIENPNKCGVMSLGKIVGERFHITMSKPGPAIRNHGLLCMIDSTFKGVAAEVPAIENKGGVYLRDLRAEGYKEVLPGKGLSLDEFHTGSSQGLFFKAKTALNLPIKKTPVVPFEKDMSKWANPMDYGAVGDGKADDTEAVQKALSDPTKTHVIFPYGGKPARKDDRHKVPDQTGRWFRVTKPLVLGETIERVIGTRGQINATYRDNVKFIIGDGKPATVAIECMNTPPIEIRTNRTVVLNSVRAGFRLKDMVDENGKKVRGEPAFTGIYCKGSGDVFLNDTHCGVLVDNPKQGVWLRHYNSELGAWAKFPPIRVKAGSAWILGWKSEGHGQRVTVEKDGALELFGFNNYSQARKKPAIAWPLFEINGGRFSCNALVQEGSRGNPILVWETRGGEKKVFTTGANGGKNFGLYTGFKPARMSSER